MTDRIPPDEPQTELDALWDELLLDACASDGPIRDNDVRQAIKHYRTAIENEAATLDGERLALAMMNTLPDILDWEMHTDGIAAEYARLAVPPSKKVGS